LIAEQDIRNATAILSLDKFVLRVVQYYMVSMMGVSNATFNNISVIQWQPDITMQEPDYPENTTDLPSSTGKT
jgi:hypothetical protein